MNGRWSGFTLVEVLVAMAIFGLMSVLAQQALSASMRNADILESRMDRLQAIQQTMRLLGRDIVQAAPRPVRDPLNGDLRPAFLVNPGGEFALELTHAGWPNPAGVKRSPLELTHAGWPNPAGVKRSVLQRSAYRIEDGVSIRVYWNVLDATLNNEPLVTELLEDVESIQFRFYLGNGQWADQWPPRGGGGGNALFDRPRMVQLLLTLTDEGELVRYFEVAP